MASNQTAGCQPTALDWQELLQSLSGRIETLEADHNQPSIFDAKLRTARIANYIADLEHCLHMTNSAIRYYEKLTANYERLVSVIEESRNSAYDAIGRLKDEIEVYKKYKPFIYAGTAGEASND